MATEKTVDVLAYVREHDEPDSWRLRDDGWVSAEYNELVGALGLEVIKTEDFGSFQGDTITLVKEGERYGVLVFGWGSCSGCDALQACHEWSQVDELALDLYRAIRWSDTREGIAEVVEDADHRNEWFLYDEEAKAFLDDLAEWACVSDEGREGGEG